jgi:hypothetical protein
MLISDASSDGEIVTRATLSDQVSLDILFCSCYNRV